MENVVSIGNPIMDQNIRTVHKNYKWIIKFRYSIVKSFIIKFKITYITFNSIQRQIDQILLKEEREREREREKTKKIRSVISLSLSLSLSLYFPFFLLVALNIFMSLGC